MKSNNNDKGEYELANTTIPTAITAKLVLSLFKAHVDNDEREFRNNALKVAQEFELNGQQELAHYIYAQYGLVRTFEVTD